MSRGPSEAPPICNTCGAVREYIGKRRWRCPTVDCCGIVDWAAAPLRTAEASTVAKDIAYQTAWREGVDDALEQVRFGWELRESAESTALPTAWASMSNEERRRHEPTCRQCGCAVEDGRRIYDTPMCHGCLPPPEPLPVAAPIAGSASDAYGLPNDLRAAKEEIHEWRQAVQALGIIGGPDALRKRAVEMHRHHDEHHAKEDAAARSSCPTPPGNNLPLGLRTSPEKARQTLEVFAKVGNPEDWLKSLVDLAVQDTIALCAAAIRERAEYLNRSKYVPAVYEQVRNVALWLESEAGAETLEFCDAVIDGDGPIAHRDVKPANVLQAGPEVSSASGAPK